ncbi:hypothetical protein D5018_16610 [Parashewanella curva]|uniref:Uncharacterized protein n=1 Tax=Parashewanella curva TaxID=2338552 RepID=A0A3L8PT37_9GAMM|nr:hypothetical protein [Parashewanella curva]RLV58561.1 hypothetical protein D5018_16610 [Parashewanella curva]
MINKLIPSALFILLSPFYQVAATSAQEIATPSSNFVNFKSARAFCKYAKQHKGTFVSCIPISNPNKTADLEVKIDGKKVTPNITVSHQGMYVYYTFDKDTVINVTVTNLETNKAIYDGAAEDKLGLKCGYNKCVPWVKGKG